jgi:dynein heavy chain
MVVHALHTPSLQACRRGADPLKLLVDSAMMAGWVRQGLPSDPNSMQNGMILCNTERWPLMMDPQLQGVVWIKERESKNHLQVGHTRVPRARWQPCCGACQ